MEAGIICVGSSSGPLYQRCALGDINCATAKVLGPRCLRLSAQWEEALCSSDHWRVILLSITIPKVACMDHIVCTASYFTAEGGRLMKNQI